MFFTGVKFAKGKVISWVTALGALIRLEFRNKLVQASLLLGSGFFLLCQVGTSVEGAQFVLILIFFAPGFLYGLVLVTIDNKSRPINQVILWGSSTAIYILCIFLTDLGSSNKILAPIKLIMSSSLGAILISILYAALVNKVLTFRRCFFMPAIFGLISALPGCFVFHFIQMDHNFRMDFIGILMRTGLVLIFPVWQTLISLNITKMENKA